MKKALGLALALVVSMSMTAAAEQIKGTVKSVDPAAQTFTLEDGTTLSVAPGTLDVAPGEKVEAVYEMNNGKKIVRDLDRRTGGRGDETSNLSGHGNYKPQGVYEEGVGD